MMETTASPQRHMHNLYKNIAPEDMRRILDYCHRNTIKNGGLFEVYSTPGEDVHMVIVSSCSEDEPLERFRPLGAFYCNYLHPGSVSIEDEDPYHDGTPSTRRHVEAVKQVVDLLIQHGYPGVKIRFNDLPALRASNKMNR
ncbi:MAG: hypothetical protein HY579_01355 [Nitrospinae bacterium]|nr:hypothetical protein [Nitrospinota bacterium]